MSNARTIVQIVAFDETGDTLHRMRWPAQALAQHEPNWRVINLDARAQDRFSWGLNADLLVLFQSLDVDLIPVIHERKKRGLKTLVEYNDNFYEPPEWSPVGTEWRSPLVWQTYEQFMRLADGVLVTGPGLDELFKKRGFKNTHILLNHLPFEPKEFPKKFETIDTELRVGWAGSLGHAADYLAMTKTIRELCVEIPEMKFCLMGNDAFPGLANLPEGKLEYTPWGSMDQYFGFLSGLHIGLAPMLPTPYNQCRSDIKAIELAGHAVLPLVSKALPYDKFCQATQLTPFSNWTELKQQVHNFRGKSKQLVEAVLRAFDYTKDNRVHHKSLARRDLYQGHFSGKAPAFNWPVGVGFHEISSEQSVSSPHQSAIQQAQAEAKRRNYAGAVEILRAYQKQNKASPTITALVLNFLILSNQVKSGKDGLDELQQARREFPEDARFRLLEIGVAEPAKRVVLWQELKKFLEIRPRSYQEFFEADVVKLLLREGLSSQEQLNLTEDYLRLYPNNPQIKLGLAEAYAKQGNTDRAVKYFRELYDLTTLHQTQREFLGGLRPGYFKGRLEGLKNA